MSTAAPKTGFPCTAIWDGVACTGFMRVPTTKHPKGKTVRYRICKRCGAKQRTKEISDGPCRQPRVPAYMKNRKAIEKSEKQPSLFDNA